MGDAVCSLCGRPLDLHDRHVRFKLPDPVLAVAEADRIHQTWQTETLMQVQGVGAFVRVLLPVHLSDGSSVTYGVWLAVHPDELQRAFRVWWTAEYASFAIDGWMANAVRPWGDPLLTAPARAVVRDQEQLPYVESSSDPLLSRVVHELWPPGPVLEALPTAEQVE